MRLLALAGVLAVACAGPSVRRFPDREPLWREPENRFSPMPARTGEPSGVDSALVALDDRLALPPEAPAQNVNSVDEVPDSSFFENRLARVSPGEVARGGEEGPGLDPAGSIVVLEAKPSGITPGFLVEDARGDRYILKLDPLGRHGLVSGAEAVASRLLWAAGYNVPDNRVVDLPPEAFVAGGEVEAEAVAHVLARAARGPDGRVRALASRFLPGKVLGSMPWRGRRRDDPNDRVPHEDRRELRGLAYLYMWINNPDAKPANSLDTYEGGRVRHYLLDFGTSFGAGDAREVRVGWWSAICPAVTGPTTAIDAGAVSPARCDALRERARQVAGDPLLGAFAPVVDPYGFEMMERNPAFARKGHGDAAWAARLLAGFTREQLEAAARASGWPAAPQRRLVERLESRRRSILRALFARVSPFAPPRVEGAEVCAEDLGARVLSPSSRSYVTTGGQASTRGVRLCVRPAGTGYRVVELAARSARGGPVGRAMRVHVVTDGREVRIVGVERE